MNNTVDYKLLFENISGLFLVLDPNFKIVAVSNAYLEATHTSRAKIIGKGIFEVFPDNPKDYTADGVKNLRQSLEYVLEYKQPHTMSVQKYDVQNIENIFEERYWSPVNSPILSPSGDVQYIIHRVEDVTQFVLSQKMSDSVSITNLRLFEKNAQMEIELIQRAKEIETINSQLQKLLEEKSQRLTNLESQFRQVLDNMLEGIQIIDNQFRYIYVNPALAKHGKYPIDQLKGKTMMEKYPGIEKTEVFKLIKDAMDNRTNHHIENKFTYPDGTEAWFELSIQPVPQGVFILSIDISERKDAEHKLKLLNEQLENIVKERTSQLESVNKELESFTYSVSHDLRSPLRGVDGFTKILEEDYGHLFNDDAHHILTTIQYNARKMGQLIDDLLAFSRLGRKDVKKADVNMMELTEIVIRDLERTSPHNAKIKIHNLDTVPADSSLMYQVMYNLIGNAIKYSSKKEKPIINISSKVEKNEVVFCVKDNGVGFNMKYEHKLFGVFQRLHSESEFDGTGVGLAIVQRIINKHGGRIWANSEIEKGAEFYFSLPL